MVPGRQSWRSIVFAPVSQLLNAACPTASVGIPLVKLVPPLATLIAVDTPAVMVAFVVIWEAALITAVGGDEVQRGQLARLLEVMSRPDISVQVLPLEAATRRAISTVFVENLTSSQYLEGDQELRGYTLVFDALRSATLSPAASAARIRQRLEQRQ